MAPASKSGLTPAQQRQRRSKIVAGVLSGVLLLVVVIQVPKLMKGHKSSSATTAAPVASTADPSAIAGAAAVTGVVGVSAATPPAGVLTAFTHFALKDPFRPLVSSVAGAAPTPANGKAAKKAAKAGKAAAKAAAKVGGSPKPVSAPVAVRTQVSKPPQLPVKKVTFIKKKPKPLPPNAALIAWNGKQELVPIGVSFPAKSPLFKLVGLNKKVVHIGVLGGSFTSGSPTMAVQAGQKLTLDNETDGTYYVFKVLKLVAASAAQIAAASPAPAASTTASAPAATTPVATTPAATTPAATTPVATTSAATTTPVSTTTTALAPIPGTKG